MDQAERYRNTVRLKINMPVALEKQEIWRYDDPPVLYDEYLIPRYPFRYPSIRDIENSGYEAHYRIKDIAGKERSVVYADLIDSKEEAESRLDYEGGSFSYSAYDVTTHHDRAILSLTSEANGDLYSASIYGRPIVLDLNCFCFVHDSGGVAAHGTAALNVTGSYFSEEEFEGKPHYEDWVIRELAERLQEKREFTVKTHRGIFHCRVGAKVRIETQAETLQGAVSALSLRYRKEAAFQAAIKIAEE
jgi:hypothetical protein